MALSATVSNPRGGTRLRGGADRSISFSRRIQFSGKDARQVWRTEPAALFPKRTLCADALCAASALDEFARVDCPPLFVKHQEHRNRQFEYSVDAPAIVDRLA